MARINRHLISCVEVHELNRGPPVAKGVVSAAEIRPDRLAEIIKIEPVGVITAVGEIGIRVVGIINRSILAARKF